jgi:hypothetical protein
VAFFKQFPFVGDRLFVVVIAEQGVTGLDIFYGLHCCLLARSAHLQLRVQADENY